MYKAVHANVDTFVHQNVDTGNAMNINFYFDEAKKLLDISTDTVLAKEIGLTRQELNRARKQGQVKIEALLTLAETTGFDIKELLAAREETKLMDESTRQVWNRVISKAKQVGGALMIGAIMTGSLALTAVPLPVRAEIFTETHANRITQEAPQVYEFTGKTGNKDYRKYRFLFLIRRLLRGIVDFFCTVSRFFTPQAQPSFR